MNPSKSFLSKKFGFFGATMLPKRGSGINRKRRAVDVNNGLVQEQGNNDSTLKKVHLINKMKQSKLAIDLLSSEGPKLNKIQVSDLIKQYLKDIRISDTHLSRIGAFTVHASDVDSFNWLLNEFTAILATNDRASAKSYVPRSVQRIKDTDKVAFVK